jgi:serine kinase of HPr protein (carbohydrate metabolism regulator)
METMIVHAGLIALYDRAAWKGVLIEGPSGCGKSDLALRALTLGFRLVADDRVRLWAGEGRLYGAPPATLAGLIEARGLGIFAQGARPFAEVRLIVRCAMPGEAAERVPEPCFRTHLGVPRPLISLPFLEASAPEKLCRALNVLDARAKGGI